MGIVVYKALPCMDTCLSGHVVCTVLGVNWRALENQRREVGSVQIVHRY